MSQVAQRLFDSSMVSWGSMDHQDPSINFHFPIAHSAKKHQTVASCWSPLLWQPVVVTSWESYWCVLRREFSGIIPVITSKFPATPSNPSIPCVKRTSKDSKEVVFVSSCVSRGSTSAGRVMTRELRKIPWSHVTSPVCGTKKEYVLQVLGGLPKFCLAAWILDTKYLNTGYIWILDVGITTLFFD